MTAKNLLIPGTTLLLILASGCGPSREEAATSFYSGAHAFGPLQWAHDDLAKELKPIADGQPADAAALTKNIQKMEEAVAERRERLKRMNPRPEGKSVQPLLESCEKHVEAQEKVWLPEMKTLLEMIEKGEKGTLLQLSVLAAMTKCTHAEEAAMKDLMEKFDAYEKEFEPVWLAASSPSSLAADDSKDAKPTKERAVQTLKNLLAALEAKDYDKAITFLQGSPNEKPEELKRSAAQLIPLREISKKGVEILAEKGKWGKLDELFEADYAKSMAERFKVELKDCYGLNLENAEAHLYWDGKQFKIFRCDDIGKLAKD